jgi:hypothetical protein
VLIIRIIIHLSRRILVRVMWCRVTEWIMHLVVQPIFWACSSNSLKPLQVHNNRSLIKCLNLTQGASRLTLSHHLVSVEVWLTKVKISLIWWLTCITNNSRKRVTITLRVPRSNRRRPRRSRSCPRRSATFTAKEATLTTSLSKVLIKIRYTAKHILHSSSCTSRIPTTTSSKDKWWWSVEGKPPLPSTKEASSNLREC